MRVTQTARTDARSVPAKADPSHDPSRSCARSCRRPRCVRRLSAALAAVMQYSLRAYVPGSLEPAGFTLENFAGAPAAALCAGVPRYGLDLLPDGVLHAIVGYPLAYALVRAATSSIKSAILVITVTPLFLGEVVRTYSWIVVLGNNGFINSVLLKPGLIEQPMQFMFTRFGVVTALVHVTLPVMVIMLAAALSHIDRDYERAAASLGAGPIRVFPHRHAAALDAGNHRRRHHGIRLDLQRFRDPATDRRRAGEHGLEPGLSARLRELQLSLSRPACRSPVSR